MILHPIQHGRNRIGKFSYLSLQEAKDAAATRYPEYPSQVTVRHLEDEEGRKYFYDSLKLFPEFVKELKLEELDVEQYEECSEGDAEVFCQV